MKWITSGWPATHEGTGKTLTLVSEMTIYHQFADAINATAFD
jgi:hypothetical protein